MVCKIVIFLAVLVTVTTAAPQLGYYHTSHEDPAHYGFSYDVHDPHTGDIKTQHETRDGDVVRGEYSLLEPDGSIRTVKYVADEHNGFQAEVIRDPPKYPHEIYHE